MKMRIASLSLLTVCCLMLAVAPAKADNDFYNNGPYNGTTSAWAINFGFSVSDSFGGNSGGVIDCFSFVYWDFDSADVLTTVDIQFGATSFGGAVHTLTGPTNSLLGTNQFGYELFEATFNFADIPAPDNGYVTLSNACTTSGCSFSNPIYWDENSGIGCTSPGCPSTAYENTLGTIPSEAFTISGTPGTTPEPSSIVLFGSGVLGLAGILRRRLLRL